MGFFSRSKNDSPNDRIMAALKTVNDPELHRDLVTLGMIKGVRVDGQTAHIGVELTTPACPLKDKIREDIEQAVAREIPGMGVEIEWSAQVRKKPAGGPDASAALAKVAHIVLVASGKGGVGKSTVAANLACGFAAQGAKVGLLDADIYGPSIPTMFQVTDPRVYATESKVMMPIEVHGMKLMSIGWLVPQEQAMIWRGPMLGQAVRQFFGQTEWGELDYLVVDLPPGTGDVQLTIAQMVNVSGAVVVSTPQDVALVDVVRAKAMFDKVNIPVIGLVENMSYFICGDCGSRHEIFSHGGAKKAAEKMGVPFLGQVPIALGVREAGDAGVPAVIADAEADASKALVQISSAVAGRLSVMMQEAEQKAAEALKNAARTGKRRLPVIG